MDNQLLVQLIGLLVGIIERYSGDPTWDALTEDQKVAKIHGDYLDASNDVKSDIAQWHAQHGLEPPK